jgi:hypothetical protein
MSYENETCGSCVSCRNGGCANTGNWVRDGGRLVALQAYHDDPICDLFRPGLECRQVRALEETARLQAISVDFLREALEK